jgi:hypothetical protein
VFLIAHGISVRTDLPVPEWLFWWAAAIVLIVSFVALAALWPEPKLQKPSRRALPDGLGRLPASRPVEIVCGAIGVFLFGLTIYAGLEGTESTAANWTPIFVYVIFWLALVPLSVLFGDVFRAFNPWRAIGRGVAWFARTVSRAELPEPLAYPAWLGRWPAAIGIFGFATMELVVSDGDRPQTLAIAALVYSAFTFIGMALYGVERWCDRGEAFSVYFNLFSRLSAFETTSSIREVRLRKPLSGLAQLERLPGTVPLLMVMIGTVSFDGFTSKRTWNSRSPDISEFFQDLGITPEHALEITFFLGMLAVVLLISAFYRLGILGARSVGGGFSASRLSSEFVHTLVPIAMAYVAAHYFTLLLYQGQAIVYLASDPLGDGSDIFGTAGTQVQYGLIGSDVEWYVKVAFIVAGHVCALILAHDRALAIYRDARQAVRSQYWMLGVMLGFTLLAVWLVSEANT